MLLQVSSGKGIAVRTDLPWDGRARTVRQKIFHVDHGLGAKDKRLFFCTHFPSGH
jgi:hypothetical protein